MRALPLAPLNILVVMFEIRPIKSSEIDRALAVLLHDASLDEAQIADKVESFHRIAQQEHYDLTRQIVVLRDNKIIYTCLMVLNAGRTAFVFSAVSSILKSQPSLSIL